ncbi:50S ribosomal protein L4 [Candidatus Woesebacteria bacterium]|jgi:large subunit ribosomal protein L4|nr:50S ribosomal protein L4 [Candidatus Woesebacteria bacterium]HNV45206.1 50S ribosomal protein L4 [Candidatus Woesebacteria bacterium]HOA11701.1 50S ribosomal protein L4 [Candidatus Woesebacteria bacterium]HOC07311.1 50S ribosomal protein L4 [Candidatus Woesebacteria bacterium]HOI05014.1 50S ribosomal protein L4 [Candidatus Woesebacteria bacterium]
MQLPVIDSTSKNEKIRVSDILFSDKAADQLLAQAIRVYQANLRQGTSYTKTRSEVKRTKKKWYKQKGTGNARHGARTPNIFVGGGVSHGPRAIENWSLKLNRKSKLIALQQALTLQKKNLFVSKDIATLKGKTKGADKLISKFSEKTDKVLVILHKMNEPVLRALTNLSNVSVTTAERLNVLQMAQADKILIDFSALKTLEDRFNKVKKKSIKK